MKKIIPIILTAVVFASCSNNAQQEAAIRQQASMDSMKNAMAQQHTLDSMNAAMAAQQNMQAAPATRTVVVEHGHQVRHEAHGSTSYTTNNNNYASQPAAAAPAAAHKKGWTGAEKGALIGAGAGAISGALIDGRKGEGAIVGGLLGAGAGAGTGALIDKHKKNKEQQAQGQQ